MFRHIQGYRVPPPQAVQGAFCANFDLFFY
ncbi:MAG: CRISPR-associated protein Cas5 [Treponema sp.]|nr:CRISPR-associated protein Cas5 [Treponema sp.]